MDNGDCREQLLLLVLASSLSWAVCFVGKNNLGMTPFDCISESLCLLFCGPVYLLDFVFLGYFSLTLLFFSSFYMYMVLVIVPWASFMLGKCCITGVYLHLILHL